MSRKERNKAILRRFPDIKLSYNKNINRKVYADFYQIIPKGQKAFMWFTYVHKKNVCMVLRLDYKGNVKDVRTYSACFNNALSYGSVFYGTVLNIADNKNKKNIFCIEDVYYYKGKDVHGVSQKNKLELYSELFEREFKQVAYSSEFIFPVLAYMNTNYDSIKKSIETLPYSIYGIKYIRNRYPVGIEKVVVSVKKEAIFRVSARLNDDIYNLYADEESRKECKTFYGVACISSYKKSVYMNSIFRKIKENDNLDYLEESDSEEEFENTSENKYVDLEKEVTMKCVYNKKFNKWEPDTIVKDGTVSFVKEIKCLENKV